MAPEQIEKPGTVDHRADIYSLGVVFYEMLTGELPIGRFAPPSEKTSVGTCVDDVVFRALEKERDRRQQSATEMRTQVEGLGTGEGGTPRAVSPSAAKEAANAWWMPRKKGVVVTLVALPLLLLALVLILPTFLETKLPLWWGALLALAVVGLSLAGGLVLRRFFDWLRSLGAPRWAVTPAIALLGVLLFPGLVAAALLMTRHNPAFVTAADLLTNYRSSPVLDIVLPERVPAIGRFSHGSVELVAVNEYPSTSQPWWGMDGRLLPNLKFLNTATIAGVKPGDRGYNFVFRTRDLPPGTSDLHYRTRHAHDSTGGISPALPGQPHDPLAGDHLVTAWSSDPLTRTSVKVGLAPGQWWTLTKSLARNSLGTSQMHGGTRWEISNGAGIEAQNGDTVVTYSHPQPTDWDTRVVAVKKTNGQEITASSITGVNHQLEYRFAKLPLDEIAEFRFQVRPFEWVEFVNIRLQPRK